MPGSLRSFWGATGGARDFDPAPAREVVGGGARFAPEVQQPHGPVRLQQDVFGLAGTGERRARKHATGNPMTIAATAKPIDTASKGCSLTGIRSRPSRHDSLRSCGLPPATAGRTTSAQSSSSSRKGQSVDISLTTITTGCALALMVPASMRSLTMRST
jgi:hypothetical protein